MARFTLLAVTVIAVVAVLAEVNHGGVTKFWHLVEQSHSNSEKFLLLPQLSRPVELWQWVLSYGRLKSGTGPSLPDLPASPVLDIDLATIVPDIERLKHQVVQESIPQ